MKVKALIIYWSFIPFYHKGSSFSMLFAIKMYLGLNLIIDKLQYNIWVQEAKTSM